jgi:hypothetical protein
LEDYPFRPFRIHLSDGTVLDVPQPWAISVGRSAAVIASEFGREEGSYMLAKRWRTVDLVHITQISDLDESRNGRRPRRKKR